DPLAPAKRARRHSNVGLTRIPPVSFQGRRGRLLCLGGGRNRRRRLDVGPSRLTSGRLGRRLGVYDRPRVGDEQGADDEKQKGEDATVKTADETGLGGWRRRMAWSFFRSLAQRKRSVRTVTVLSIVRQVAGSGRNPGLSAVTSTTTCCPSASFQTKCVLVAPN